MLPDLQCQLEPKVFDPLIGRGHVVEVGDLNVDVLNTRADRVDWQAIDRSDRDGVGALVDPQEADLELETTDGFVDEVGEPSVEHGVVIPAHLMRLRGRDSDMADSGFAGDEAAADRHVQRHVGGAGPGEQLLCQAIRAGEPHQTLNAMQPGLLRGSLDNRHTMASNSCEDFVVSVMVVDLPAERGDVLGWPAPQQKPALVVVEPESQHVGAGIVDMHADGVVTETPPVGKPLVLNDDIAQVDAAKDVHRSKTDGALRKSMAIRLNSSARSHCIQWPVREVMTSSALGIRLASIGPPDGRLTLSSRPHNTNVGVGRCLRRLSRVRSIRHSVRSAVGPDGRRSGGSATTSGSTEAAYRVSIRLSGTQAPS